ncbi:MAG TPA: ZIP family metal transporter [Gemmatimonadales bacterium]|nr:ZIP family metal transporter [Gemmatimonadales bacterium]
MHDTTADRAVTGWSARVPLWLRGVLPLALLALVVLAVFRFGPANLARDVFPPVEELTIQRLSFPQPGVIHASVVNGGPEAVTIAQVMVDQAYWVHNLNGPRTVERLGRRDITIRYPWVTGEPVAVTLVTSTGLTFSHVTDVAVRTPTPDARYLLTFALIGIYVGVIPVFIGLLWLPFLRGIDRKWVDFFLALTIGLLVFLGVDAMAEALETASLVPSAFQGISLALLGVAGAPLIISAVGKLRHADGARTPLYVATLVALGIGLHNLGEGLAIGTAYASGAVALGAFLVIGFLLHNTTEGLGIVAPLGRERPTFTQLALLGLLAGAPTIIGAWIGGFTYSPALTTLFFALGAGAVIQVVWELWKLFRRRDASAGLFSPLNTAGLLLGMLIMYATGLLVPA